MKRTFGFVMAAMAAVICVSCARQPLADMRTLPLSSYAAIEWEDRVYIPYTPFERSECGPQIGIVNGDENDKVYTWSGHNDEEWIINGIGHDGVMLLRERSVTTAPEGLTSEYPWNADIAVG